MSQTSLEIIRQKFLTKLAGQLPAFSQLAEAIAQSTPTREQLGSVRLAVHQIAGSAKTFGFAHTSDVAANVEALLDRLLEDTATTQLNHPLVITKLQQAFDALSTHVADLIQTERRDDLEQVPRAPSPSESLHHYKVLIADDDALVVELLRDHLQLQGCEVIEVNHGQDVLNQAHQHRPHLIIQDVNMPDRCGFDVLRALKADTSTRDIPVIMLTKRSEDTSVIEGIANGAADYMLKPFEVDQLIERIMKALRKTDTKILIADDDPLVCELLTLRLRKLGYQVHAVNNGTQALAQFKADPPDLLLLDIMMPGMDGMAVLKHLKAHMQQDTPVVMLTAKHQSEHIVKSLNDGAHDYIVKPFDLEELVARVNGILRRQAPRRVA